MEKLQKSEGLLCGGQKFYDANAEPLVEGRNKVRDEMWQVHMRSPAEALQLAQRKVIERGDATTSIAYLGSKSVLPPRVKNGFAIGESSWTVCGQRRVMKAL